MLSVLIMVLEYHHVYHSLNGYLRVTRALIFISWFFPRALGVRSTSERELALYMLTELRIINLIDSKPHTHTCQNRLFLHLSLSFSRIPPAVIHIDSTIDIKEPL
jgi:hypothetical protein